MLEKNKESSEFATVIFSTIIYALLSLMISYNIIYAVYIAIFLLSLGMFFLVLLIMSKIIETSRNQKNDIVTELMKIIAKCVPIILIYQIYLLDYVFISGMFFAFSVISICGSLAKMIGVK